jgi:DNA-binding transcriptional MerR regulator
MQIETDLLSSHDVARLAGVAASTVRYWDRIGQLPAIGRTAGGIRLFARPDVERFIEARTAMRAANRI